MKFAAFSRMSMNSLSGWKDVIVLAAVMVLLMVIQVHFFVGSRLQGPQEDKDIEQDNATCFDHASISASGNSVAFVTMIAGNQDGFLQGACTLAKGIRKFWKGEGDYDALVIELSIDPLTRANRMFLKSCGWITCTIPFIEVRNGPTAEHRLQNCYSKLHAWNLLHYDRVVLMDADMLVVDDISHLASVPLGNNSLAAVRDYWNGEFVPWFNGGLLIFRPDAAVHARLLRELAAAPPHMLRYYEQSFLNDVFAGAWLELDGRWAANLDLYCRDYKQWKAWEPDIKIVHYTVGKPWDPVMSNIYVYEIRQWWHQQQRPISSAAADAFYGAFGSIRRYCF